MKVKLVRVFRWIIFCSIIIFFLYSMTPYYAKRKGADYNYQTIQEMRENPEVLVFGSSYSELAFMPNELYKNYGITSYNLSAPSQRLDTSYYVIESIIQEKNPKVIIMVTDYINEISRKSTLNEEILSIRDLNGNEIKKWKYLYSHFGFQTMEYIKFHFPILQFHQDLLTGDLKIDDLKQNKHLKKLYQKLPVYYK